MKQQGELMNMTRQILCCLLIQNKQILKKDAQDEKWKNAMDQEIDASQRNSTLETLKERRNLLKENEQIATD